MINYLNYDWIDAAFEELSKDTRGNPYRDEHGRFTDKDHAYLFIGHTYGTILRMERGRPVDAPVPDSVLQGIIDRETGGSAAIAQQLLSGRKQPGGEIAEAQTRANAIQQLQQRERGEKPSPPRKVAFASADVDTMLTDLSMEDTDENRQWLQYVLQDIGNVPTRNSLSSIYAAIPGMKGLTTAVTAYSINIEPEDIASALGGDHFLQYNMEIKDKAGNVVGAIIRQIGKTAIQADYMALDPKYQNTGLGSAMVLAEAQMVESLGKSDIFCAPGMSVGGYVWAKFGFDFYNVDEADGFRDKVSSLFSKAMINIYHTMTSPEDRVALKQFSNTVVLDFQRFKHAWEYAAYKVVIPDALHAWIDSAITADVTNTTNKEIDDAKLTYWRQPDKLNEYINILSKNAEIKKNAVKEGKLGKYLLLGTLWAARMSLEPNSPGKQVFDREVERYKRKALLRRLTFGLLG